MREMKFRLWDKKNKEMIYSKTNRSFDFFLALTGQVYFLIDGYVSDVSDRYDVMQYTGLKDKNEKEIYEGDIVKTNQQDWIAKVVFDVGMFYVTDNEGGFDTFCEWDKFEIIGNIYENPELLNKEN